MTVCIRQQQTPFQQERQRGSYQGEKLAKNRKLSPKKKKEKKILKLLGGGLKLAEGNYLYFKSH